MANGRSADPQAGKWRDGRLLRGPAELLPGLRPRA